MNGNSKEKNLSTDWQNNDEQRNDSIFQEEGDYIINEMPKYKYEIKVIHESPNRVHRAKKVKTPDRISTTRFTIVNMPKLNNIKKKNNKYINKYNKENFIKKLNMDIRTEPTIRFYSVKKISEVIIIKKPSNIRKNTKDIIIKILINTIII